MQSRRMIGSLTVVSVAVAALLGTVFATWQNASIFGAGVKSIPGERRPGANYPHARNPAYGWGFSNKTGPHLQGVGITWGSGPLSAAAGDLEQSNYMGAEDNEGWDPMPDHVTMHWRTPDNQEHTTELAVASLVPDLPHFTGIIWFKFENGTWTVVPISDAENMRRMKANERVP